MGKGRKAEGVTIWLYLREVTGMDSVEKKTSVARSLQRYCRTARQSVQTMLTYWQYARN
jgi:hypothetical protein